MSLATNPEADARTRPAAMDTGTMTSMLACVPRLSDTAPISGSSTAIPGMAKTDTVEKADDGPVEAPAPW